MGGSGSKDVNWGDQQPEIQEADLLSLTRDVKDKLIVRLYHQREVLQNEFSEQLFDRAEDTVKRFLHSPLLSPENKQRVEDTAIENTLGLYIYHKRNLFSDVYRKAGLKIIQRVAQLVARQVQFERLEEYCKVDGFEEDCRWVVGPVWRQKYMTLH